jgi:predicted transcriptional regulator
MTRHALFLSIQPQYAQRIMAGQKRVELRRVRPRIPKGTVLLIYVSSPVKALQAISTVRNITEASPDDLWRQVSQAAGVTRSEFNDYFDGTHTGFAIHFGEVQRLSRPLALSELREVWPDFNPPQVYQYFTEREVANLLKLVKSNQSSDAIAPLGCRVLA